MTVTEAPPSPRSADPDGAVNPPAAPPAAPPAGQPPAPPAWGAPPSDRPPHAPSPRGRGRFLGGAAVGALVGALVAGGIVAVADHDGRSTTSTPSPSVPSRAAAPAAGTNTIAALVQDAEPSIVAIHDSIAQTDIFGRTVEGQAAGTGFVLTADGYIVTNDHVVDGATDISVDFSDGTSAAADVVAADPGSDLAVLKVDETGLAPLPLGSSDELQIGDQVVAIGNALDLSGAPTVTTGIVSATGRSLDEPNGTHLTHLLQTDTAINPGNSGGPLLDMQGQVVGINTAIAGQAQNIGFAIAIDPAKALIDQLQAGQVPEHALLGVNTRAATDGVQIVNVSAGSAADDAGLQAGDVITRVDDQAIANPDELATVIGGHQPGDRVAVRFERDGSSRSATVTLGARPTQGG